MQDTRKEVDKMKNTMKKPVAIPVEKLRPFAGHPFKVRDDDEMNTLIESIQTQGILSPLIVRPIENTDEYEVISGHRRLHAAQKAGITEILMPSTGMLPPLRWWTATSTGNIFCPLKRRLRIS